MPAGQGESLAQPRTPNPKMGLDLPVCACVYVCLPITGKHYMGLLGLESLLVTAWGIPRFTGPQRFPSSVS